MYRYAWCGLSVRSDIEIPGLAVGRISGPESDIEVCYAKVAATGLLNGSVRTAWRGEEGELLLAVRGVANYRVRGGRRIEVDPAPGAEHRDLLLFLLGSAFGALWHQRGVLPLHASSLEVGSDCVAFAGPSRAGKSTLAAFLTRRGYPLVADDVSILAVSAAGGVAVWPGPPRLKLWLDGLTILGEDPSTLSRAGGRWEKYHLPVDREADRMARPVPLTRLYVMIEGDRPRIERLTGLDAVEAVALETYCEDFIRPMGLGAQHFRLCVAIAKATDVRRLVRPRGFEHMESVLDLLEQDWHES